MPFDIKDMSNGLKTVANIPISAVGENWMTAGGPKTVTPEDLQSAVDALADPAIKTPRVKLGHLDPRFTPDTMSPDGDPYDGTPVLGRFENLQLGDKGMTLYADAVGVPAWFANIMPFAYPNRSVEGDWDIKTVTGQEHRFVITAVALLGDEYPAIETLDDLQILFSKEGPDWADELINNGKSVAASRGGFNVPRDKRIAASVSVEDIRRSFFEDFATAENGRWDWWTRAVYVDPELVIATDFDDNLFACPFSIVDDKVEWGEPAEVFTQYVETDSGKIAASKVLTMPAVARFSKETGSRPETHKKGDTVARINANIDPVLLRQRLGLTVEQLPDDATEEQINQALTAPEPGTGPDTADTTNHSPEAAPAGTEASGAIAPGTPSEGGTGGAGGATTGPTVQPGQADFARVDPATLAQLQADASAGRAAREEQMTARRHEVVEKAIRAGKIPPARRDHYRTLMKTDEEGTTALLDSLTEGVIPVGDEEHGGDSTSESDALSGSEYPSEWLTDAERHRVNAAREGKMVNGRLVQEAVN
jgi:hypothetical protein